MKPGKLFLLLGLLSTSGRAIHAQTFTNLHSFSNGGDGNHPYAGMVLSGSILCGTAFQGGNSGYGTVFKINADGTGLTGLIINWQLSLKKSLERTRL